MNIRIDTRDKTIHLNNDVKMFELMDFLQKIFSKGEWTDYTLICNEVVDTAFKILPCYPYTYVESIPPYKIICETNKTYFTLT